jgi:hypothetical protein
MHKIPLAALAATLLAGQALSADTTHSAASKPDGFRIESEAQFVRDYGDRIERVGTGVYVVTRGPMAGKTITIGESGLAYELAALRARVPSSPQERKQIRALIQRLERSALAYKRMRTRLPEKAAIVGTIGCYNYNWSTRRGTWYSGGAYVSATAEYYMSNGGGGLNPYYARAYAAANGSLSVPFGVPYGSGALSAYAVAWNHNTNVIAQNYGYGNYPNVASGIVYSGPDFSHNLESFSGVEGEGDCVGHVSISATLN